MADSVGQADIRGLNVSKAVTGFALRMYRFKQLCTIVSSSSWQERYYQETSTDLTNAEYAFKGVPRLAVFPHAEVTWTQQNSYHLKHGAESVISWEDTISNDVDAVRRTLLRVARGITKSVDTAIWAELVEMVGTTPTPVNINTVAIAVGNEWDSATIANRDPIQDILDAKTEIDKDDYDSNVNGYLCVNSTDWGHLLGNANVRNAGQFFTDDVTRKGNVGFLLGLKVIVSNNVTADYAAVVLGGEACTWQQLNALKVQTITEPGISVTIRAWETGVAQLKNPNAVCLLSNTAA